MKRIILILFLGFFCCAIKAQISTEEIPYSWSRSKGEITKQKMPVVTLPHLDIETINKEDSENDALGGSPVRFGFSHDVNLNLSNSGVWQATSEGGRLWNLRIYSPDALSLNLLYDKFWLPDGAKFFIYSEDMKQYIGAFTSENNKGDKERKNIIGFATGFLYTNSIVLEYYEPNGIKDNGIISIAQVVSGYRYVYDILREENQLRHNITELTCHNDVNCAAGNGYENEKNAVAHIVMGNYICTGSLLNTTANDNRPVFLSANHCFAGAANTMQWIFYWNYEAPCGNVVNRDPNKSTAGATVLANSGIGDFLLLCLNENPAMNSNISVYYLGWDRTASAATKGAGIHHPNGAQKKISLTNSVVNHPNSIIWSDGSSAANTHWKVNFNNGTTEGGSSGSPLLNQNKRVVGQLHGGNSGCPPNAIKYYGRFDVSWNGDGASSRSLKDWLDPLNTNVTYLNGTNCNIVLNNKAYNLGTYSIGGCTVEISNTTIEPNATVRIHGQQSVVLKPGFYAKAGSNVRITAGGGIANRNTDNLIDYDNEDTISMRNNLELAAKTTEININNGDVIIYPNPNNGNFTVKMIGEIQPYTVEIFNSSGGLLGHVNCNDETVNINRADLNTGIYYIKITMDGKITVKKIIVQ
ncbi:MAG: T9SS type A sorting domain-containing protein [Candidatus Azobacteroides sp.]|nr:T9SS type A sorting domain-containing protein [Candidatus Azobacteroides sp.]